MALSPTVGVSETSATAGLRSATHASHQRLEKRLDVKNRFGDPDAYRSHLEKMWGFCAAIERRLGPDPFGGALSEPERRFKVPLLTRDLIVLGADAESVLRLPRCEAIPELPDPAAAFGCAYVLEGATLGGRILLPLVTTRLGLTADRGAAFLASYGEKIPSMWTEFRTALDTWCHAPERRARSAQTAVATFTSLEQWLCGHSS